MKQSLLNAIKPGSNVLVTAGAGGIGRSIAETFLAHDCHVHVCDINPAAIVEFQNANLSAQDVANMALFLASDLGKSISGAVMSVDGHTESLSNLNNQ